MAGRCVRARYGSGVSALPAKVRSKAMVWVVRPGPGGLEVLLLERPRARGGGFHPVTGKANRGETPAQTAAREALEETGLSGALDDLGFEHRFPASKGNLEWVERAFQLTVAAGQEPSLSDEHIGCRWVTPSEAVALVQWSSHRAALERLRG
jgi:8-oxo-dGTP pyrophosphatase MutT (NUDIX family)